MKKSNRQSIWITIALFTVLFMIVGATGKNIYTYYTGADYVVDTYINCLNQKDYTKLYTLLDINSTKDIGGKKEVVDYYQRTYEREKRLVKVEKMGQDASGYKVQYRYASGSEKGILSLVQVKGKWYIDFPFQSHDVEVFAPYGAKVYLDSKVMTYTSNQSYQLNHVLPGSYLLKVEPVQEGYQNYYKMVRIPEDKVYVVPYEVAHLTIEVAPGFEVVCNEFSKISDKNKVEFEDLLLGDYQVVVQDLNGYFEPQSLIVEVNKGENIVDLRDFDLSAKGEKELKTYLGKFYKAYLEGIKAHDASLVEAYFTKGQKEIQKDLFSSWFVDQKDISNAQMNVKLGESRIDKNGLIHVAITENIELTNQETNESEKLEEKKYKVVLTWETIMNPLNGEWKIAQREITQSIVAVEDKEEHWVQY